MPVSRVGLMRAALALCLLVASPALAQDPSGMRMRVTLGTPPEFEVDVRYFEPSDLFAAVKGSRVLPFWVSARNVAGRPATLQYDDFLLRLGNAGSIVTLNPIESSAAVEELRKAVNLGRWLRLLTGQGGEFATDPLRAVFRGGNVAPRREVSGWVFFLRPDGVAFTGFMDFGTVRHPAELLSTASVSVSVAPTTTRSGSTLPERVINAINGAVKLGEEIVYGQRPFGKSYAVLFGVSEYDYRNDLRGPAQDLQNLEKALMDQGFDVVARVINREVRADTLRNIQQHFKERLQPDDRLLVYYAGHGDRDPTGGAGYIVLTGSNPTARSRSTEVSMTEFMGWMKALPVKHLLVILDACYAGHAIGGVSRGEGPPLDAANRQALYQLSSRSGRFVITAGDEMQRAHEHTRWDGGLFTRGILRALETRDVGRPNDRLVTTFELFVRTKQFVTEEVRRYGLSPQAPLLQDLGETPGLPAGSGGSEKPSAVSRGEFVFVNLN
jgi:hypothetical protein